MEDILRSGLETMGIEAPPEAAALLRAYGELLLEANARTNLTAIREPEAVARLHFLDSAALLRATDLSDERVVDVGTGAGLPGIVLRALRPGIRLTLMDSARKKLDFVSGACQTLGLGDVTCLWGRAEELSSSGSGDGLRERFDVAVSRAVARLDVLSELCLPLVTVGGRFLAMKGPDCGAEVEEAAYAIDALGGRVRDVVRYELPGAGVTHAVVVVEKRRPTPVRYPRRFAQIRGRPLRPKGEES